MASEFAVLMMDGTDMQQQAIEASVISTLEEMVQDWGLERPVHDDSRLVADLEFESIDVIQLVVALEQRFVRRNLGFNDLLMKDGRYIDDLSVREISEFLAGRLS